MSVSAYKPWLRNLYARRLFILFGVPIAIPAIVAYVAIKTVRETLADLIKAWQPERLDKPLVVEPTLQCLKHNKSAKQFP